MFRLLNLFCVSLALAGFSLSQVPVSKPLSPPTSAPAAVEEADAARPQASSSTRVETGSVKDAAPAGGSAKAEESKAEGSKIDTSRPPQPGAALTADKKVYTIGPEDSLYVRVWHEPDLSGTLDVRPDGYISMQLIGEMKVDGMSLSELSAAITKRLQDFIKNPEVNVQLLRVNSKKYTIQGEVNRPGSYPLTGPVTILEALVNASGFRDFANTKKIYLLRGSQRFNFNYKQVSKGKNLEQNIQVQNGDQIFVP